MKVLQKLASHLKEAKKNMDKGYNHKALEALVEAETVVREELRLSTHRILAEIALMACKLEPKIKHHEVAIDKWFGFIFGDHFLSVLKQKLCYVFCLLI